MEELLKALWLRSLELNVDHVERGALCGLSSGYLSMYRLGLLFPWTLDGEFGGVHDSVVVTNKKKALDIMVKEEAVADISSESGREDELPAAGSTHGLEL